MDYFNRRWYEYTRPDFGRDQEWRLGAVLHPEDVQNCIDRWTHSVTSVSLMKRAPVQAPSDGVYRWHLGRAVPIHNAEGAVVRWFGTCTDIGDYKQAQAAIQSLNENLEDKVRQRTEALRESEERFRSFVGTVKDYAILMLDRRRADRKLERRRRAYQRLRGKRDYRTAFLLLLYARGHRERTSGRGASNGRGDGTI
jgi:PAS domain-containing protein